jgi:hypothetical protein
LLSRGLVESCKRAAARSFSILLNQICSRHS